MERKRISQLHLRAAFMVSLFLQNLVIPVVVMADAAAASFEDQKNFFFFPPYPYPGTPTTPPVSYTSPPAHSGQAPPTPYHSGGGHGSPPHARASSPPTPSGGKSGGGYYNSPPTKPVTPPTTPAGTSPSPPLLPVDPNSPPFTCTYWRTHPTLIWGLVGWWGLTMGSAFGVSSLPGGGYGSHMNLLQALSNTHTDGYGQLYREGTAALLNSMAHTKFAYTTTRVRDSFVAALSSNKAAAAQADLFKMANNRKE